MGTFRDAGEEGPEPDPGPLGGVGQGANERVLYGLLRLRQKQRRPVETQETSCPRKLRKHPPGHSLVEKGAVDVTPPTADLRRASQTSAAGRPRRPSRRVRSGRASRRGSRSWPRPGARGARYLPDAGREGRAFPRQSQNRPCLVGLPFTSCFRSHFCGIRVSSSTVRRGERLGKEPARPVEDNFASPECTGHSPAWMRTRCSMGNRHGEPLQENRGAKGFSFWEAHGALCGDLQGARATRTRDGGRRSRYLPGQKGRSSFSWEAEDSRNPCKVQMQTERQMHRYRDRGRHKIQRGMKTETERHKETQRDTARDIERDRDVEIHEGRERKTQRQRKTERQIQTETEADTDRQKERHSDAYR